MTRLLRHLLLAAALVALLAACSSVTRVAYNNAAFAGTWVVDDWFDLDEGQRDWVKERLERFVEWHRATELPAYERLLQEASAQAGSRITAEDARRIYGQMRVLYHRSLERAIPDMADFLLQVRPAQVEHLERKFAADNTRAETENRKGTPAQRREARAKRFVESLEDWTGRLTAAQRSRVHARVEAMQDIGAEWMGDRRRRQAATLALIRSRPSREAMVAGLTRLLVDTATWRRPEYAAMLKSRDESVFALIAEVDATLSPEQRDRLQRRLGVYVADVAYLMAAN